MGLLDVIFEPDMSKTPRVEASPFTLKICPFINVALMVFPRRFPFTVLAPALAAPLPRRRMEISVSSSEATTVKPVAHLRASLKS